MRGIAWTLIRRGGYAGTTQGIAHFRSKGERTVRPEKLVKLTLVASMVTGVAACGGGGGGDSDVGDDLVGSFGDVTIEQAAAYTGQVLVELSTLPIATSLLPSNINQLTAREVFTTTVSCVTGSYDIVWNDVDNDLDMTVGDIVTLSFNDCVIVDGAPPLDGSLEAAFTELGTTWGEMDVEFMGLAVGNVTYNGRGQLRLLQDGEFFRNELTGGPLDTGFMSDSGVINMTMTEVSSLLVIDEATLAATLETDARVAGDFAGTVLGFVVETVETFRFLADADDPWGGEYEAVAGDGSRLHLQALSDATTVDVTLTYADGTVESLTTTWDALEGVFGDSDADSETDTDTDTDTDLDGNIAVVYQENCQQCHPDPTRFDAASGWPETFLVDLADAPSLDFSRYAAAMTGVVLDRGEVIALAEFLKNL